MSTFINCSMVSVLSVYPHIRKVIQSAFVSCVMYHHDVKVILYDGCLEFRGLCNCSLCVPMYLMWVASLYVPVVVVVDRPEVECGRP